MNTIDTLRSADLQTPAYVYSENELTNNLELARGLANDNGCRLIYSLKSLAHTSILSKMLGYVDGFAASSIYEAKLAREVIGSHGTIHYTSPGLRDRDVGELMELCDYLTLNSVNHWRRLSPIMRDSVSLGMRINPMLPLVDDERYDPCSERSKLGAHIPEFTRYRTLAPHLLNNLSGLHFHTNCEGKDYQGLLDTVTVIVDQLDDVLEQLDWFNIGGGYFFSEAENYESFHEAVQILRDRYGLNVFMEPGGTVVRSAGFVVATVLDIVGPKQAKIAILDTTINHMPEVYEYEYEPDVVGDHSDVDTERDAGFYDYVLAGSSCLAGDIFGDYVFAEPLKIGDRVIFKNMGCYTLVKAHMFNGINLPSIYFLNRNGELSLERRFTYGDFLSICTPTHKPHLEELSNVRYL